MLKISHNLWLIWLKEWKENKFLFILEFIGTFCAVMSAATLSFTSKSPPMVAVYLIWLLGNFALAISSYYRKATWWLLMILFYILTNLIGLFNLMI